MLYLFDLTNSPERVGEQSYQDMARILAAMCF